MRTPDDFIDALARVELSDRACNQYARPGRHNALRRRNLRLYLEEIAQPCILLVGEAPSHRGGRLTGIPFTSETIMLCGAGAHLGEHRGYRKATPGPHRSTEASATMVWGAIRDLDPLPLLWNAFPFHPFQRGNPFSNRIPTTAELRIGERFIEWLISSFPIDRVIAVGNHADRSLTNLGLAHQKVRHPSQGGKRAFVSGMKTLGNNLES